jgi:hypothetical protein
MSRLIFLAFLFQVSVFLFSCASKETASSPPDPATENFNAYLRLNFDDSVPGNPHLFILISKKASRENTAEILDRLKNEVQDEKTNSITSILSVNMPVADSLIPKGNLHTDWNAALDKLKINSSAVTLIRTDSCKIREILPLTLNGTQTEKRFLAK